MTNFPQSLQKKLTKRRKEDTFRKLDPRLEMVDFSSNDYLGFAKDTILQNRLGERLDTISKIGATGSRLLTGDHKFYKELEAQLCRYHLAESALVFNSGYDANLGFFSSVPQRNHMIFYDELCHASIRDGIRLSNARSVKFKHNDLSDLKDKLVQFQRDTQNRNKDIYVATESVFSMDGDTPDLKSLSAFCSENNIYLIVDEAHAVGVFRNGLINRLGLENEVFARIITFGKALGSHGAAILGSKKLRSYLINFARSFIYTTALPPHSILTTLVAYDHLPGPLGEKAVNKLENNISFFKSEVRKKNLHRFFLESESAVQIYRVGTIEETKKLSQLLCDEGFDVKSILAPTVPSGQERLRICLHAFNTENEIEKVLEIIKKGS
ncbi:MAG: pyridoxal phosphate-dependent aminotransferase family protein [Bacteroidota bacterium]